jgi:hypothetical protein
MNQDAASNAVGQKPVGVFIPTALFIVFSLQAWWSYHLEVSKGRNEYWSRGSAAGTVLGSLLIGSIIAALFSIGKPFRTWRAWLTILLVVSALLSLTIR